MTQALTEPDNGSDASGLQTTATKVLSPFLLHAIPILFSSGVSNLAMFRLLEAGYWKVKSAG